jgi:hypothetical protein
LADLKDFGGYEAVGFLKALLQNLIRSLGGAKSHTKYQPFLPDIPFV